MVLCAYTVGGFVIYILWIYKVVSFLDIAEQFLYVELRFLGPGIQFTPKPCLTTDLLKVSKRVASS